MNKNIRDKEIELQKKWGYLKELSKDNNLKKHTTYELREAENELYNKWKFYKGFIKAKENIKDEENKGNINMHHNS